MSEKYYNVTNKSAGRVIYKIPEDNIRREFYPRETKKISIVELNKLSQQPGGRVLLFDYLFVQDPEAISELINAEIPPEYWLTEDKIPSWMESCSLAEFQDALDFAPEGTKDLIKTFAVSLPLNDYSKRNAIKEQLGFDVTNAIENSGEDDEKSAVKPTGRRVQPTENSLVATVEAEVKQRRVVTKTEE